MGNSQNSGSAKLVESILDQVLDAQVKEHKVAKDPYERTEELRGNRNGSYLRKLTARVGNITLHVPRIRNIKGANDHFY